MDYNHLAILFDDFLDSDEALSLQSSIITPDDVELITQELLSWLVTKAPNMN